jgi:hypothetical protein
MAMIDSFLDPALGVPCAACGRPHLTGYRDAYTGKTRPPSDGDLLVCPGCAAVFAWAGPSGG